MEHVDERNGGNYVAGTRVSLDSVAYAYRRGESASEIVNEFPVLTLDQVESAIRSYLANREMVDEYLVRGKQEFDRMREEARAKDPALYARLEALRRERQALRS